MRELYVELATALQVARDEDRSLLVSFFEKRGVSGEKLLDLHRQKPLERKLGELLEKSKSVY